MSSVLAALVAWSGAALAGCENPTSNEEVVVALEAAVTAYESLDVTGFRDAAVRAEQATLCLDESITRANAAELHRIRGLVAFVDRQEDECRKRFAAARNIEPEYSFPVSLVPEGNPVLDLYGAMDPTDGAKVTLPWPKDGSVRLDGSPRLERNEALPVIFQRIDVRGAVVETLIIPAGGSVPEYPEGREPKPVTPANSNKTAKRVLLVGGAASVVAAGGLYGAALGTKSSFDKIATGDEPGDPDRINRLYNTNHALVIGSAALGVVGIGLGSTSFVLTGQF
ncbi:MAG: hypothetical protein H6737_19585 [Alphaproteobacteria bacterium]|nr:hypothetical protein [Alphaproteobacteria bacterium]